MKNLLIETYISLWIKLYFFQILHFFLFKAKQQSNPKIPFLYLFYTTSYDTHALWKWHPRNTSQFAVFTLQKFWLKLSDCGRNAPKRIETLSFVLFRSVNSDRPLRKLLTNPMLSRKAWPEFSHRRQRVFFPRKKATGSLHASSLSPIEPVVGHGWEFDCIIIWIGLWSEYTFILVPMFFI